jgi:hypothetical protein
MEGVCFPCPLFIGMQEKVYGRSILSVVRNTKEYKESYLSTRVFYISLLHKAESYMELNLHQIKTSHRRFIMKLNYSVMSGTKSCVDTHSSSQLGL